MRWEEFTRDNLSFHYHDHLSEILKLRIYFVKFLTIMWLWWSHILYWRLLTSSSHLAARPQVKHACYFRKQGRLRAAKQEWWKDPLTFRHFKRRFVRHKTVQTNYDPPETHACWCHRGLPLITRARTLMSCRWAPSISKEISSCLSWTQKKLLRNEITKS